MNSLINKFWGPIIRGRAAFGLLLLRLVVGGAFVQHALANKVSNPFHWGDGLQIPPLFQGLATLAEFGGGLGLIFGFLTPISALGIAFTMLVAYLKTKVGKPWIGEESFEDLAFYFIAAVTLILTGPGKFSIDSLFVGKKK